MQSFFNKSNCIRKSTGIALTRNVSDLVPSAQNGNPVFFALIGERGHIIFKLKAIQFHLL